MRTQAGYSLLEMMISMLVFLGISAILFTAFSVGELNWKTHSAQLNVFQPMRTAMDGMVREIRQATVTTLSLANNTSAAELSFNMAGYDIAYYVDADNNLIRENPPGTTQMIMQGVTNLNFTRSDPVVSVVLSGQNTFEGRQMNLTLSEKARLRNAP